MTNALLLAFKIIAYTNQFQWGACDPTMGYNKDICWTAQATYYVPTSGVYCLEYNPDLTTPWTNWWTGQNGSNYFQVIGPGWTELNVSSTIGYYDTNGVLYFPHALYTNTVAGTNTVTFPTFPWDQNYYRLKRKKGL